jgi:hypothetical protein
MLRWENTEVEFGVCVCVCKSIELLMAILFKHEKDKKHEGSDARIEWLKTISFIF